MRGGDRSQFLLSAAAPVVGGINMKRQISLVILVALSISAPALAAGSIKNGKVTSISTDSTGHALIAFSTKISAGTCGDSRPDKTDACSVDLSTQEGKTFLETATNAMRFALSVTAHGTGTCTSYEAFQVENLARFHVDR
jgi:hypothetical protein